MKRMMLSLLLAVFTFLPIQAAPPDTAASIPVINLPFTAYASRPGFEERGSEFRAWLAPSVRIGGGSGTMCYYDDVNNYMYIISCGHLFERGRSRATQGQVQNIEIHVFYHNRVKLSQYRKYTAQVLCHVWGDQNSSVYDVSLMRFKPDWKNPMFLPIAPLNYAPIPGQWYRNCGCDGRSEAAHYLTQFVREENIGGNLTQYATQNNGPRPGRSGGGMFTDDGLLIGICSRGDGQNGLWSSLKQIHKFLKEEGYGFVLNGYMPAREIPVIDRNNPTARYDKTFIPVPRLDQLRMGVFVP